jgi:hypothetical protein
MNVGRLLVLSIAIVLCCSVAQAYTLTFDDIPSGNGLDYYKGVHGVTFASGFSVVDRAGSAHSGTKVLTWACRESVGFIFADGFSGASGYYPLHYTARSVGAYFSTDTGVVIRMCGYRNSTDRATVASVIIGRPNEAWSNQYAEISSEAGEIGFVEFEVLEAPSGQYTFCADDVTVTTP